MAEQTWTDDPTSAGTAIKAVHPTELQVAIDDYNTAYSQGAVDWNHGPSAEDPIEDGEWDELIIEVGVIAVASTKGGDYGWVNDPCAAGDVIDSVMIEEIRDNLNDLQANYCITCDTCNTDLCDCDPACNTDGCDQCDSSADTPTCDCNPACNSDCTNCTVCYACNSQGCAKNDNCSGCVGSCNANPCSPCNGTCNSEGCSTCDSTCDSDACDACDGSCNVHSCASCDGVAYRYPWT